MLIFFGCLLAMFLMWLFGHILGAILYVLILFVGHLISFWYIYLPAAIIIGLCVMIGTIQVVTILALLVVALLLTLLIVMQLNKSH